MAIFYVKTHKFGNFEVDPDTKVPAFDQGSQFRQNRVFDGSFFSILTFGSIMPKNVELGLHKSLNPIHIPIWFP